MIKLKIMIKLAYLTRNVYNQRARETAYSCETEKREFYLAHVNVSTCKYRFFYLYMSEGSSRKIWRLYRCIVKLAKTGGRKWNILRPTYIRFFANMVQKGRGHM